MAVGGVLVILRGVASAQRGVSGGCAGEKVPNCMPGLKNSRAFHRPEGLAILFIRSGAGGNSLAPPETTDATRETRS